MIVNDSIYPVVESNYTENNNYITTHAITRANGFPFGETIDDSITYSASASNYAPYTQVLIYAFGVRSNQAEMQVLNGGIINNPVQKMFFRRSDIWSNDIYYFENLYREKYATELYQNGKYIIENNNNMLARGYNFFSNIYKIYCDYFYYNPNHSNNPWRAFKTEQITEDFDFSNKHIAAIYLRPINTKFRLATLCGIPWGNFYDIDGNIVINVSRLPENYTFKQDEIFYNYNMPYLEHNAGDIVIFGGETSATAFYYKETSWGGRTLLCFAPQFAKFETLNGLSNIPVFNGGLELVKHIAATMGLIFTTATGSFPQTVDEIMNNDLIFIPKIEDNGLYQGEYYTGQEKKEAKQYKEKWWENPNAPWEKGVQDFNDIDFRQYGDDNFSGCYGATGALTNRYFLNRSKMKQLSNYLNNTDTDLLESILKNIGMAGANPINSIVSIMYSPLDFGYSVVSDVIVGSNLVDTYENPTEHTALSGSAVHNDNIRLDLGAADIKPTYKNYLDYAPYTKYIAYIPFCNFVELEAGVITNKTVSFYMNFDTVCGSCECEIRVNGKLYKTVSGVFATECCVQGNDNSAYVNSILSGATKTVGGIGGIITAIATENPLIALGGIATAGGGAYELSTTTREFQANGKSIGLLSQMLPLHVCLYRYSVQDLGGDNFTQTVGAACGFSARIGNLKGLVICQNPVIDNITATPIEIEKIKTELASGIYV